MKSLRYQRRRRNWTMGMLTNAYQKAAGVRFHDPPGMEYQMEVSGRIRLCQSLRPTVQDKKYGRDLDGDGVAQPDG